MTQKQNIAAGGGRRGLRLTLLAASGAALAIFARGASASGPNMSAGGAGLHIAEQAAAAPWVMALSMLALGGCNGSLAELISRRLPAQRSLWWPPSACDACGRRLRWWHNLPLISYPCLLGRCSFCRAAIPLRGYLVELMTAAAGWALWWRLGLSWPLLLWLPLSLLIVAVSLCDLDHWWVPDVLTLAAAAWVLICAFLPGARPWSLLAMGLVPAALLWGVAWAFARLRGFEGLGLGDIKWAAVMGTAVAGPAASSMIFWASLQAAAAGLLWRAGSALRRPVAAPCHLPSPSGPVAQPTGLPAELPAALLDDADWRPPPGALPFAPFIGLAALEVVLFPDFFAIGAAPLLAAMGYPAGIY